MKVLSKNQGRDAEALGDAMLKQALVGPAPNQLILSYLRHSLSAGIVSHSTVLLSISQYQSFVKLRCVSGILTLLQDILPLLRSPACTEDPMSLGNPLLSVVGWLLTCFSKCSGLCTTELRSSPDHLKIIQKVVQCLKSILDDDFLCGILILSCKEDADSYSEVLMSCEEVKDVQYDDEDLQFVLRTLESFGAKSSPTAHGPKERRNETTSCLDYTIHGLVSLHALFRLTEEPEVVSHEFTTLARALDIQPRSLYCEIMRSCYLGLSEASDSSGNLLYAAFLFLKIPSVFLHLHSHFTGATVSGDKTSAPSADLISACEDLITYVALLDVVDAQCNCNSLESLLQELQRTGLLSEEMVTQFLEKRQNESQRVAGMDFLNPASDGNTNMIALIRKAAPTIPTLLKTLTHSDNPRILEVLSNVVTSKTFELIFTATGAECLIPAIVERLINFLEDNRSPCGENSQASGNRAALFDFSFLLLVYILQRFPSTLALHRRGETRRFFDKWVTLCFPEKRHNMDPHRMTAEVESAKTEAFLQQLKTCESDMPTSGMKWDEACWSSISACQEILVAWETGSLQEGDVQGLMDTIRIHMGCMAVSIAYWLHAHIQTQPESSQGKPQKMLDMIMSPVEESHLQASQMRHPYTAERWGLTLNVLKWLMEELKEEERCPKEPLNVQLLRIWSEVQLKEWFTPSAMTQLKRLYDFGGVHWFCKSLIEATVAATYKEEVEKGLSLALAAFHIDLIQCAIMLLSRILPDYLLLDSKTEFLCEPRGTALAKLTVTLTYLALSTIQQKQAKRENQKRKLSESDEVEEALMSLEAGRPPPIKIRRLDGDSDLYFEEVYMRSDEGEGKENPLEAAIHQLFALFSVISQETQISSRLFFVAGFLREVILCSHDQKDAFLQHIPSEMLLGLMHTVPEKVGCILDLCDLKSDTGRQVAAQLLYLKHVSDDCKINKRREGGVCFNVWKARHIKL
ncbi:unnamed protein product, partial [Darwinula stevensoni]